MSRISRLFYGWFDKPHGCFRISRDPADAPVRASLDFESDVDAEAFVKGRRGTIMWDKNTPLTKKKTARAA